MLTIRKAGLQDVPELHRLISRYAAERVVLPRPLADLYENVWEFTVAEEDGVLLGCGALKFYSDDIAEIRSLCVDNGRKAHGIGRAITRRLLEEAQHFGLKTVFALTLVPEFFGKLGFREVPREKFPSKVWRDCIQCEKYFACNEKAVSLELARRHAKEAESRVDAVQVPS